MRNNSFYFSVIANSSRILSFLLLSHSTSVAELALLMLEGTVAGLLPFLMISRITSVIELAFLVTGDAVVGLFL